MGNDRLPRLPRRTGPHRHWAAPAPEVPVFETGDGASAEIVVSLLSAYKVPCTLQKSGAAAHFGLGRAGWWRVLVQAADEARAQAILDAEIGHGEGE